MKKTFFGFMFIALFSASLFCNPADLYQKGAEYQANEDWYGAIEMYQSALKENPSYNLVYQQNAFMLLTNMTKPYPL